MKCGIKHGFGDQVCCREAGHDGPCRCKAARGHGTITYSEWYSEAGKFKRHKKGMLHERFSEEVTS